MTTLVLPHAASSTDPVLRALTCELRADGLPAAVVADAAQAVAALLADAVDDGAALPGGALHVSWWAAADGPVRLEVRDAAGTRRADVGALVPH